MNTDSYMPDDMDWAFLPANRKSADYEALLNVFLDIYFFSIYRHGQYLILTRGTAFFITIWP